MGSGQGLKRAESNAALTHPARAPARWSRHEGSRYLTATQAVPALRFRPLSRPGQGGLLNGALIAAGRLLNGRPARFDPHLRRHLPLKSNLQAPFGCQPCRLPFPSVRENVIQSVAVMPVNYALH